MKVKVRISKEVERTKNVVHSPKFPFDSLKKNKQSSTFSFICFSTAISCKKFINNISRPIRNRCCLAAAFRQRRERRRRLRHQLLSM